MAQKPSKDPFAKPPEADKTVRLPRKNLGLERDEPTQALQMGTPPAASTLRLKRDEMSLDEPTTALERPSLRTAMEVIEEATQAVSIAPKPSVMMPDASDIPSWEEVTEHIPPPDKNIVEDSLEFPDVSELDEIPGAMMATQVMPVMGKAETVAPPPLSPMMEALHASMEKTTILHAAPTEEPLAPMEKTMVMQLPEAPAPMEATTILHVAPVEPELPEAPAPPEPPEPMEATTILRVEPVEEPLAPMEKTMVMQLPEAPAPMEATTILHVAPVEPEPPESPEPMEATTILRVEPAEEPLAPMEKTMVMQLPEAPAPMEATIIVQKPTEDPTAFLTRQGQAPLPLPDQPGELSPGSTQLMSGSLEGMVKDATKMIPASDSWLAPVPPAAPPMERDSPLAKASQAAETPIATRPVMKPYMDVAEPVDTSVGMAMTPRTLLMPVQPKDSTPPEVLPSVPGYPDRSIPAPLPEPKVHPKPVIAKPEIASVPAYYSVPAEPSSNRSWLWIPVGILLAILVGGGIYYFAFFNTNAKSKTLLTKTGPLPSEPSLPVPPSLQPTLDKARAGDAQAMHLLGVSFFYGQDVPRNRVEGIRWLRKAAAAGSESAKSDLHQMEIEMH